MVRKNLYLTSAHDDEIREIASRHGVSYTDALRDIVQAGLNASQYPRNLLVVYRDHRTESLGSAIFTTLNPVTTLDDIILIAERIGRDTLSAVQVLSWTDMGKVPDASA